MKDIVLYGAGGMAREVAILIGYINEKKPTYNLLGYVVDSKYYKEKEVINGLPVLGTTDWLIQHKDSVVCALCVGEPLPRKHIMEEFEPKGVIFETLIAPDVYIDPSTTICEGTIIQSRSLISTNLTIGKGCFLNTDVSVGHDVEIDSYTVLNPRAQISGYCRIGKAVMIGAMSFLNKKMIIEDQAVVAPGSVVFRKVKAGTYVMGNPAHKIDI